MNSDRTSDNPKNKNKKRERLLQGYSGNESESEHIGNRLVVTGTRTTLRAIPVWRSEIVLCRD